MCNASREVPSPIKRHLRQEAGFGCCACGHPFIEYHHIIGFSVSLEHDSDQMMVLCPNHHHQATVGALSESDQRRLKAQPHNVRRGNANGLLLVTQPFLAVEVGSNQFVGDGFKFLVDGQPLLQLTPDEEGRLQLSLDLYDPTDHLLITVSDNEWITGDPLPWDFEFSYNRLTLRRKARDVTLSIDARRTPVTLRGDFWRNRQNFHIDDHQLLFSGVHRGVGFMDLALVALQLAADTSKQQFAIVPDPRFGEGIFVSWPDPEERLRRGLEAFESLKASRLRE